jgi:serine/threonine protein phosphatase PrpC
MNCGAATDTGRVRERNEDRYWADPDRGVFLVVDGVGGCAAGEIAAETAVDVIRQCRLDSEEDLRVAIACANNRIFTLAAESEDRAGMACVLTLAVVREDEILIGHVGDSRLYLIWDGAMRKLTPDHSPVGEDEDAGELSEVEAMRHPRRNEVFRDVGSRQRSANDPEFVEVRRCRFRADSAILLCSDGLTDRLTSAEIRGIIDRYDGDSGDVAQQLVGAANRAGGDDNVTTVFVAGPDFRGRKSATRPLTHTASRLARRKFSGRLVFLAFGVLIGMLLWAMFRWKG